jgi:hypothetical protein
MSSALSSRVPTRARVTLARAKGKNSSQTVVWLIISGLALPGPLALEKLLEFEGVTQFP